MEWGSTPLPSANSSLGIGLVGLSKNARAAYKARNDDKIIPSMSFRWLIRATMWVRNPPSPARVKLVLGIIALCLIIGFIEHYIGWPDWAKAERIRRLPK